MSTEKTPKAAPATLTEPLSITLNGLALSSLDRYRQALHAVMADPEPDAHLADRLSELKQAETNLLFWVDSLARTALGEPQGI